MDEATRAEAEKAGVYEKDKVLKIINSVIAKVEHAEEVSREAIYNELTDLQAVINEARSEIGAARPSDISDKHVPMATDELDAVVEATAEATGTIMDCCDVIMEKAGEIGGESGDAISAEIIKIYEACSFQDITGQRITKVVSTIKSIEEKVRHIMGIISDRMPGMDEEDGEEEDTRTGDDRLLNGPQMVDKAISQDDIDKLLAEFD